MSQGLPDGFVRTGLKTYLIAKGTSTQDIANLIALVSWPWAIKWVWGPVIDSFSHSSLGRRRPWILAAQFGMGMTMGSMIFIPTLEDSLRLLGIMVLAINCFSSLQDVAIDALAIDLLPERERGIANGLMFGSSYIGSFLGGAVVGSYLLTSGVAAAVMLEMVILGSIAIFPLLFLERCGDRLLPGRRIVTANSIPVVTGNAIRSTFSQLKIAFSRRPSILAALLAICSLLTTSAYLVYWPVHVIRDLDWTSEQYLVLEGRYAVLFGLAGCLSGGVVASWLGAKPGVLISLASLGACWLVYAATANVWNDAAIVSSLFVAVSFLAGFFQVSMFALFMGVCSPVVAATQFSAYMALLNVSSGIGAKLAALVGADTDLRLVFMLLACSQLAMVPIVVLIRHPQSPMDLPEAPNKVSR
jgi:PAT family beta-lactamase induction signal transducer AmpG